MPRTSTEFASMTPSHKQEIYHECERLVYRFLKVLEGEQGKTADLFTDDGEAFTHVGRENIRKHFASIESVDNNVNVNLSSNLVIDVRDSDHAEATNYVTHYVASPESDVLTDPEGVRIGGELQTARSITRWHWEFRRVDGEWWVSRLHYPNPVLLRKDVINEL